MIRLSVLMITFNEAENLPRALASVPFADQVVVVDSGSTDRTADLARAAGARVEVRPFTDYADQRNAALALCDGDLVLALDADEEVTPDLAMELVALKRLSPGVLPAAWRLHRRSLIFGRWFVAGGTQHDRPVRLFQRGQARWLDPIHEHLHVDGPIGGLAGDLRHLTYPTLAGYFERFNRYTSREAAMLQARGRRAAWWRFVLIPPARFLKQFIVQAGFRDGGAGLLYALFSSWYDIVKYAKLRELSRPFGTPPDPPGNGR